MTVSGHKCQKPLSRAIGDQNSVTVEQYPRHAEEMNALFHNYALEIYFNLLSLLNNSLFFIKETKQTPAVWL